LRKSEAWLQKRAEAKAAGTLKKKKNKRNVECYAHLTRFNDISEVDETGLSRKLSKKEKLKLF